MAYDAADLHDFQNHAWAKDRINLRPVRNSWRFSGGQVVRSIPANTFLPLISGIPTDGETLVTTTGTWTQIVPGPDYLLDSDGNVITDSSGQPLVGTGPYSYQWLRDGTDIPYSTQNSYVLTAADVGHLITVAVSAQNTFGLSFPVDAKPVGPIADTLAISGTPILSATVGESYTGFTVSASGGWAPYLFNVISGPPWPPGITMDGRTGIVAGTPTESGVFANTVVQVTDRYGDTANLPPFTITVEIPLSISGTPIGAALQDSPYAGFTVVGAGGAPPYVYSVTSGSLPAGITLNSATGVVSGTPTGSGTSAGIVISVTDALSDVASLPAFSIVVAAILTISGTPFDFAVVNQPYLGFSVSAAGGYPNYNYTVTAGSLPVGITLNSATGAVSGIPTVLGTSSGIVITATDSQGNTASLPAFSIAVGTQAPVSLNFSKPSNSQYEGLS